MNAALLDEVLLARVAGQNPRVLVVGDVMIDKYVHGTVTRTSPESGAPVVRYETRTSFLGGAGNVARQVNALGGFGRLVSAYPYDMIKYFLNESGIEHLIVDDHRHPTIKRRVMDGTRQICRIDRDPDGPISDHVEGKLLAAVTARVRECQAVVISDYAKGVCTPKVCRRVIDLAQDRDIPVIVDPKGADYEKYRGATVVKPNLTEAKLLVGSDSRAHLRELFFRSHVLVTRDGEGMELFTAGNEYIPIAAHSVPSGTTLDPTGAGDMVAAALGISLACRSPIETAARFANVAAGLSVRKPGTTPVTIQEIREFLNSP